MHKKFIPHHFIFANTLLFALMTMLFISCANNRRTIDITPEPGEATDDATREVIDKCGTHATVKNMEGLDGCGMVFRLDNGDVLMPENMEAIQQKLRDGQEVRISYTYLQDRVSACMAGKIVSIDCVEEMAAGKK